MSMAPQPRVRVMVVEDSLVVRQLLVHIIASDPRLMVAAAVSSAEEALQEIGRVQPDVISMDIRLPGMDGLGGDPPDHVGAADAHRRHRRQHRGFLAQDLHERPAGGRAHRRGKARRPLQRRLCGDRRDHLHPALHHEPGAGGPSALLRAMARPKAMSPAPRREAEWKATRPSVMGIAASTGGPPALAKVLGALPAEFPAADPSRPAHGRSFHGGLRLLAERPDAARRPARAGSGDPVGRPRLRRSRRPAPAPVARGHAAE